MGAKLRITRADHSGAELRVLSAKCGDGAQVCRMLALALILDERPRGEAASLDGMDRQTLCDWVHRYNAGGLEGLKTRKSPGKAPLLTDVQKAELRDLVLQAPDSDVHKDAAAEATFKKLCQSGARSAPRQHSQHADRDLVPG